MTVQFLRLDHELLAKEHVLVDMHLHTKYSMDCATKPALVYKMARKNHIGIAVTDHNDIKGVKALSAHKDLLLIPGIEVTSKELKDILLYFESVRDLQEYYDKVLLPHKGRVKRIRDKIKLPMQTIIEKAKQYQATIAIPHPFALKNNYLFFSDPRYAHLVRNVDAVEVANGTQGRKENLASYGWSQLVRKPAIGGSDSHIYMSIGCIVTATHGRTPASFLEQVRSGNSRVFGTEARRHVKIVSNLALMKNKLLKNKRIPLRI